MRVAHLILTLLICLGAVAAQENSGSNTTSKKKTSETSASGTGSSTKKKTTSSSAATSSSSASKSKPKSTTSSGGKTANTDKETAAQKEETPKSEETKKESEATTAEKKTDSSKAAGGEKKDSTATGTSTSKAKTDSEAATSPSKKTTRDSGEPAEEEGTDERDPTKAGKRPAAVSSITPEEIEGFEAYPAAIQQLIRRSLELTTQNLRYQFGSADPKAGGMDCSGTMYRVLQDAGIKDVPRQSDEICRWVMRRTLLYRTEDTSTLKDKSLSALKPGDLLFWTGTYDTSSPRELPISHVMLYLGKRKKDGKPVVFGASDGRSYDGQRRNGVSVFDFVMPKRDGKAAFYGYGPVPGLENTAGASAGQ